ncbi:MAG: J domain-containing protein [Actinomycetota bacterium]
MAPRFSRRREADEPPEAIDDEGEDVHLDSAEHAWWASRDINDAWSPHERPAPPRRPEPERDVLAEHLGEDWRSAFGFDPILDAPRRVPHEADRVASPRPEPAPPSPAASPPRARRAPLRAERRDEPVDEPEAPIDPTDPYSVLGVESSATWEEIVDAHRRQARRHHPDQLFGHSAAEIARAEERIRDINVAYQELRVRRGK